MEILIAAAGVALFVWIGVLGEARTTRRLNDFYGPKKEDPHEKRARELAEIAGRYKRNGKNID